jgi:hypothetical protein
MKFNAKTITTVLYMLCTIVVAAVSYFLGKGAGADRSMGQDIPTLTAEIFLFKDQLSYIDVALRELHKENRDVEMYQATLYKDGSNTIVIFKRPNTPIEMVGSSLEFPTFSVEMDADFNVVAAHLSR